MGMGMLGGAARREGAALAATGMRQDGRSAGSRLAVSSQPDGRSPNATHIQITAAVLDVRELRRVAVRVE